jgi:PEP-CTERM motif
MTRLVVAALASAAVFSAAPASAAVVVFTSGFEGPGNSDNSRTPANDPNTQTPAGDYGLYLTADGWTADDPTKPIELQNNVAGAPDPTGGNVFVELDSTKNSSMSRIIAAAGKYNLTFLYSPRPGRPASTNGIEVLLNGVVFNPPGVITGGPHGTTQWSSFAINGFTAAAGSTLTFRAVGTSDSFGGYVDNITLAGVPEPSVWAFMILGFGLVGGAMRSRKANVATAVRFA